MTCELLEAPDNGRVVVSGMEAGDRATYSCLPSYELDGVAVRLCQDNGQWTFEESLSVGRLCVCLFMHKQEGNHTPSTKPTSRWQGAHRQKV